MKLVPLKLTIVGHARHYGRGEPLILTMCPVVSMPVVVAPGVERPPVIRQKWSAN